jgi:hypothetical protein
MIRPITDTLRHIGAGCLIDEASEKLSELVNAVSSTGKAGKLTITIDIRKATAGALAVAGKVTIKKPAEPAIEVLMFPTPEGNLLTEDPSQIKLDLRSVTVEAKEIRAVAAN